MIKEIIHLENNENHKNDHCFYKISNFINYLCSKFKEYYIPMQNITLGESMISYKGRSSFKAYIPSKPHKWGIKLYSVCESNSGYCLNCAFDPGKSDKNRIKSTDLLMLKYFVNKFHIVYTSDSEELKIRIPLAKRTF